jgi:hypothetical protein
MSEAFPTMWGTEALPSVCLIARVLPRSRKKRLFDAPKVGLPVLKVGPGQSHRMADLARVGLVSDGQEVDSPSHPDFPGGERGNEPSQGYRPDLQRHDDATYVNVGTLHGSSTKEWASLRLSPCRGRNPRSSRSARKTRTGRRGAVGFQAATCELSRRTDV